MRGGCGGVVEVFREAKSRMERDAYFGHVGFELVYWIVHRKH